MVIPEIRIFLKRSFSKVCSSSRKIRTQQKNTYIMKILSFYPIIAKLCQNEVLMISDDWIKVGDFFKAYFCMSPDPPGTYCMNFSLQES